MADIPRGTASCNDRCGCATPCPGGDTCRCTPAAGGEISHKTCLCGEHCSCAKVVVSDSGRASCHCGNGCACTKCAS